MLIKNWSITLSYYVLLCTSRDLVVVLKFWFLNISKETSVNKVSIQTSFEIKYRYPINIKVYPRRKKIRTLVLVLVPILGVILKVPISDFSYPWSNIIGTYLKGAVLQTRKYLARRIAFFWKGVFTLTSESYYLKSK